jgi:hypothetical protein
MVQEILKENERRKSIINATLSNSYTIIDDGEYWTSLELNNYGARTIYFTDGHYWGTPRKSSTYQVRAVLAF